MRETISAIFRTAPRSNRCVAFTRPTTQSDTARRCRATTPEPTFKASDSDLDPYFYSTPLPFPEA